MNPTQEGTTIELKEKESKTVGDLQITVQEIASKLTDPEKRSILRATLEVKAKGKTGTLYLFKEKGERNVGEFSNHSIQLLDVDYPARRLRLWLRPLP